MVKREFSVAVFVAPKSVGVLCFALRYLIWYGERIWCGLRENPWIGPLLDQLRLCIPCRVEDILGSRRMFRQHLLTEMMFVFRTSVAGPLWFRGVPLVD
jgi:hypothetical protein